MSFRAVDSGYDTAHTDAGRGIAPRDADVECWMAELAHTPLHLIAAEYTETAGWQQCSLADLICYSSQRLSRLQIVMRPGCPGVFSAIQFWDADGCWGALFLDRNVQVDEVQTWLLLLNAVFDLDSSMVFASDQHCSAC